MNETGAFAQKTNPICRLTYEVVMGLDPFAFRAERLHVIRLEPVQIATNKAAEKAKSRPWISHLSRQSYIAQLHAGHRDKASNP